MSTEQIDQIAASLEIPEHQISAFRMGYYSGKMDQLEESKKTIDAIQAAFSNTSQNALDAFLNSGHSTPATDEQKREKLYDDQEAYLSENIIGE